MEHVVPAMHYIIHVNEQQHAVHKSKSMAKDSCEQDNHRLSELDFYLVLTR